MTHLYIELNTGLIEEVSSSIISKLYELAISGDLDNTSDLKGRLHSASAKEKHVTYLNNNFDDLYISADIQYLSFDDPDVEDLMKRYIGTSDGVTSLDVQTFVNSGTAFGSGYTNTHTNRSGDFCTRNEEKALINTFDEINLFNGLTSLGNNVFNTSNLTSILLPSSITTLGGGPFGNCNSLTSITGLSNITSVSSGCFYNCSNLLNTDLNFANLTSLELLAFYNCTSYPFGDLNLSSVVSIGKEAFRQCTGITKLTLNDNVSITGDNAFWHCTNMTQADLGSGITFTNKGHSMFAGCTSLITVTGMSEVTTIPQYMFVDCTNLTTVDIDLSNITGIGNRAFLNCQSLNFSGTISLDVYPDYVFEKCKNLTTANVDFSTCTNIGQNAFNVSGLSGKLYLPLCTSISRDAFRNISGITEVDAPELITSHQEVFNNCTNISKISIPKLETSIYCAGFNLLEEYNAPKQKQFVANNFTNCTSLTTLVLDFGEITTIPSWTFANCTSLSGTLDFAKVTSIGTEIFKNCTFDVIFRATTFPTLTGYSQMGGFKGTLYVDDSLLVDYQTQFPAMGSRIKAISELPS